MGGNAKFRFSTRSLSAAIQRELIEYPKRAERTMNIVGGFLNGQVKLLCPVDKGNLTADISNDTRFYKNSFAAVVYIPLNAPSSKYAIPMHENKYRIGKNSIAKMRKTGKAVGRKYITRALYENAEAIRNIVKREIGV